MEEETLQTKEVPGRIHEVAPDLEPRIQALHGSGQPLPESARAFFEPRFGHDFSRVRIHRGSESDALNRSLGALAFTVGRNIFFRRGEGDTGGSEGRRLLSHELVHVVQQTGGEKDHEGLAGQDRNFIGPEAEGHHHCPSNGSVESPEIRHAPTGVQRECALYFEGTAHDRWALYLSAIYPNLDQAVRSRGWSDVQRIARQMSDDAQNVRYCLEANRARIRPDRYRVLLCFIDEVLASLRIIITQSDNIAAGRGGNRVALENENAHLYWSIPLVQNHLPPNI